MSEEKEDQTNVSKHTKLKTPFKVTFVGTGGVMPHKKRLFPFILIEIKQKIIFLDFGEGSQRTLLKITNSLIIPDYVFISHYHLDHYYGILPYLKTLEMMGVTKKIKILLPDNQNMKIFQRSLLLLKLNIELNTGNQSFTEEGVVFSFFKTNHTKDSRGIILKLSERRTYKKEITELLKGPQLAKLRIEKTLKTSTNFYIYEDSTEIIEKEVSLIYTSDTAPLNIMPLGDYLIHECTYLDGEQTTAVEKNHSCLSQLISKLKNYKKIFLVHLHPKNNHYPKLPLNWSWPKPYEIVEIN